MAIIRYDNSYKKGPDSTVLFTCNNVCSAVTANPSTFPAPSPSMTVLQEKCNNFKEIMETAASGDKVLVEQKKVMKQDLLKEMTTLGYYVLMVAKKDRLVVIKSGFPLLPESNESQKLAPPTDLKVAYGVSSGEMLVSVKAQKAAASYLHQYTTDPELKEGSWMTMNCTTSKCKLTGLTPGTLYFFRVGAVGTRDQILFSYVVSKMAA